MKEKNALLKKLPSSGAVYGIILFVIIFSMMIPGYLTIHNISNIARQSAVLCFISMCSCLAILTNQTDYVLWRYLRFCGLRGSEGHEQRLFDSGWLSYRTFNGNGHWCYQWYPGWIYRNTYIYHHTGYHEYCGKSWNGATGRNHPYSL